MNVNPNDVYVPPSLYIAPSPIHGNGVFAKRDLLEGELVAKFTGIEMSRNEILSKYGDLRFVYRRMPWQKWICSRECPNVINFVNDGIHGSNNPYTNCVLKGGWLRCTKDIKKDEELLLYYGRTYWKLHKG